MSPPPITTIVSWLIVVILSLISLLWFSLEWAENIRNGPRHLISRAFIPSFEDSPTRQLADTYPFQPQFPDYSSYSSCYRPPEAPFQSRRPFNPLFARQSFHPMDSWEQHCSGPRDPELTEAFTDPCLYNKCYPSPGQYFKKHLSKRKFEGPFIVLFCWM